VFGEEADGLGGGVEKEVRDLADKPGQQRAKFGPDIFKAAGHSFSSRLQSFCKSINNCTNSDARGKKDGRQSDPVFFEDFLYFFAERHGVFSFRDLSLQPRELFVSFFHPCLCSLSV